MKAKGKSIRDLRQIEQLEEISEKMERLGAEIDGKEKK
jgi:hypothetical protein